MRRSPMKRGLADNHLSREEWEAKRTDLLVRSGGLCEARTLRCLAAPDGLLVGRLVVVSVHHRKAQGMGGTDREDVHDLHHLLIVCGDGVVGCHGWIESERDAARARGLLVDQAVDATVVPVELASGRLVLLDPVALFYVPAGWRF